MNDLTFFTNEEGKSLADRFKKIIQSNTQFFDILVGYFRASGFYELYEALENVEKIRIPVGINVDEQTLLVNNIAKSSDGEKYYFTPKEIRAFTHHAIKQELEDSDDTYEVDLGVKKFIEYIENGKIEIRVYPYDKIHAKVYIMRKDQDKSDDYGKVITGSSNFSYSGLKGNLEFNVELRYDDDIQFATETFEKLWAEAVEIDITHIEKIKNESYLNTNFTPYEVYLKFLI